MRFTFNRDQPFVRVYHTLVISKNSDTDLLTDISLQVPLAGSMQQVGFEVDGKLRTLTSTSQNLCNILLKNAHPLLLGGTILPARQCRALAMPSPIVRPWGVIRHEESLRRIQGLLLSLSSEPQAGLQVYRLGRPRHQGIGPTLG